VEEKVEAVQEKVQKPVERMKPEGMLPLTRPIRLGDKVRLRTLGTQGVVTALSEEEAEVQVGVLRVRARLGDLQHASGSAPADEKTTRQAAASGSTGARRTDLFPASPGMELDLRGQRAEDALDALDRYLDAAYLAGLPFVRIIHGKGTGRLREVVRQTLSAHPNVKTYESGGDREGGEGVTIAKLNNA